MASFFGIDTERTNVSSLFSTPSSSSSTPLGDYEMIRSGSYKKLLKAYYDEPTAGKTKEDTTEVKKEKQNLVVAKSDADALKVSAESLKGLEFSEENRENITKSLKSFVETYNKVVDSGSAVDTKSVLQNTLWMTQTMSANSKLLSEAGIKIGKGSKLEIDEEKLGKADLSVMKTLFSGSSSVIDRVINKASKISNLSGNAAVQGQRASNYTNSGDFKNLSTSALFDRLA